MDESFNASDISDTTAIMLPPDVFTTIRGNDISIVFSMFNSSILYPLTNKTFEEFDVASTVVSATIVDSEEVISANITVVLKLNIEVIATFIYTLLFHLLHFHCLGFSTTSVCFLG